MNIFLLPKKYQCDWTHDKNVLEWMHEFSDGLYDKMLFDEPNEVAFKEGLIQVNRPLIHSLYFSFGSYWRQPKNEPNPQIYTLLINAELEDDDRHLFYLKFKKEEIHGKILRYCKIGIDDTDKKSKNKSLQKVLQSNNGVKTMANVFLSVICKLEQEAFKEKEKIFREKTKIIHEKILKENIPEREQNIEQTKPAKKNFIHIGDGIKIEYIPSESDEEVKKVRKFIRHCEQWQVRGHYRHYTDGKVVFVHEYTKGKGRLKDNIYLID